MRQMTAVLIFSFFSDVDVSRESWPDMTRSKYSAADDRNDNTDIKAEDRRDNTDAATGLTLLILIFLN